MVSFGRREYLWMEADGKYSQKICIRYRAGSPGWLAIPGGSVPTRKERGGNS